MLERKSARQKLLRTPCGEFFEGFSARRHNETKSAEKGPHGAARSDSRQLYIKTNIRIIFGFGKRKAPHGSKSPCGAAVCSFESRKRNYIDSGAVILNIVKMFRITVAVATQSARRACISGSASPFTRQAL